MQVWHVHDDAVNADGVVDAMPDGGGGVARATGVRRGGVYNSSEAFSEQRRNDASNLS